MKVRVFIWVIVLFLLSGCRLSDAYAAKREAEAYSIRTQAEQRVKDQEVERKRVEAQNAYKEERRAAIVGEVDIAWRNGVRYFGLVLIVCIIAIGISIAISFKNYSTGMVEAKVTHAKLQAQTIMPDPITGLFPLFYANIGRGRISVYNPNTKEVLMLDVHHEPDQEAIRQMGKMLNTYVQKFATLPMKEDVVDGKMEMVRNLLEAKV